MTDKPVTVTPELLPCRKCGAICRVETWAASEVLMTETNLWMCSESTLFDGECDGDAYVSAEAWNTRTAHAPSQSYAGDDRAALIEQLHAIDQEGGLTYEAIADLFAAAMPSQHSELADRLEMADKLRGLAQTADDNNQAYVNGIAYGELHKIADMIAVEPSINEYDEAEKFRRGNGGKYDREVSQLAATFAALRQSPQDVRRYAVIEECAKVADDHAFNAWHIADAEGQNSACASGRNYGGRAIAAVIRALGTKDAG